MRREAGLLQHTCGDLSPKQKSPAALKVSVPVTQLAKWKTTIQLLAIGFLLTGPAGDKLMPYTTQMGLTLLWVSAIVTLYTGYDYFRAGAKHMVD